MSFYGTPTKKPPMPVRTRSHAITPLSLQKIRRRKSWYKHRKARLERDNYTCQICFRVTDKTRTGRGMVVNHERPLFQGGTDDVWNLKTYCARCDANRIPQD